MDLLDKKLLNKLVESNLNKMVLQGSFGLEKENIRVDAEGKLALTPHPEAFGKKMENPYIKTDFSESQIEMITPVSDSIEEAYHYLETIHDLVTLELKDEYLWPSSNPPILPDEADIPIADMENNIENEYRTQLAQKYGRKKQMLSGIHFNFSFPETFLKKWYELAEEKKSFRNFKDEVYLKVARNFLKFRWLLIYLTGASPIYHQTYEGKCIEMGEKMDDESYYFPKSNSFRNSSCGYQNKKPIYVSFASVAEYVQDLQDYIRTRELLSVKEFYCPIRIKASGVNNQLPALLEKGIDYLEVRTTDLNPFMKIGISKETMRFIHLFLVYMLLIQDEPFGEEKQRFAQLNHDAVTMGGILERYYSSGDCFETLQEAGMWLIKEMKEMIGLLSLNPSCYTELLDQMQHIVEDPSQGLAGRLIEEVKQSTFLEYHLDKAKEYAQESAKTEYRFAGLEDMELSTQLLLKAAMKRGIQFEILDREDNFIALTKNNHIEYVKQATKTSQDSYSTVLIMENKIVTKKVLRKNGIRVPKGEAYHNLDEPMSDFPLYHSKQIVIKPKSTNFGLGITIFTAEFSMEDYRKAFEMAFTYDQTVLLEEYLSGKEYRFLVMGDDVVGILHRVPANVIGDGIHTINQLVMEKNKDPLRGHGYKTPLEIIQLGDVEKMFLKNQGTSVSYIPKQGELVYLRENSNISTGGDSIDFTDEIPDSYKQIALRSAKAAGAVFCGVDMVIDDIREEASQENYGIIEINFNPAIHIHCYPYRGKNRKADDKILDLLFGPQEDFPTKKDKLTSSGNSN
jgi:glutamate--cysteine ligase